ILVLHSHLSAIISSLIKAQKSADNYPKSGRNPVNERIILVLELDNILSERIDCHLTTTKVSLFSSLLTLVYQEATGRADVKNVGDLLQDAKKWLRIVHPGGVIEYRPQDTD